ncbi:MAG: helix-turn-helix domain-containing protein, partial [Advenella sp.]
MNIDLLTLKLFIRVVVEGTISRAAELENFAAAAVSRRLSELEDKL